MPRDRLPARLQTWLLAPLLILAVPPAGHGQSVQPQVSEPASILDLAVQAAEAHLLAGVQEETNLTWKSDGMARIARLLGLAGRFDRAEELIRTIEPERIQTDAWAALALIAVESRDFDRAMVWARHVARLQDWSSWPLLRDIATALRDAGRPDLATQLVRAIPEPREQALALLEESRWRLGHDGASRDEVVKALGTARQLAAGLPPGGYHVVDWSARQSLLLDVLVAFVEAGASDEARQTLTPLGKVSGLASEEWQARGLLELARDAAERGRRDQALKDLRQAWELAGPLARPHLSHHDRALGQMVVTLGLVSAGVEIGRVVAAQLHALGETKEARAVLAEAQKMPDVFDVADESASYALPGLVENWAHLAPTWRELGRPVKENEVLKRAQSTAARIAPTKQPERADALSWIAAALESASDPSAQEARTTAVAAILQTPAERRDGRWQTLAEAFSALVSTDRGVEVLTSSAAGDEALYSAATLLAREILLSPDPDRLAPLLDVMPFSYARVQLQARLASRRAELGRRAEADALVDDVLRDLADDPEGWPGLLSLLAREAPGVEATSRERRELLARIAGSPG